MYVYIYIYIYICMYVCIHIYYIYIYILYIFFKAVVLFKVTFPRLFRGFSVRLFPVFNNLPKFILIKFRLSFQ